MLLADMSEELWVSVLPENDNRKGGVAISGPIDPSEIPF